MSRELISELRQIVKQHETRLNAVINRCVLNSTNDKNLAQVLNVSGLASQLKQVELFEQYGFTAKYLKGAEVLRFAIDGYEDLTIATGVSDKRHRPDDLKDGEICIYTNKDLKQGLHRIHLKDDKSIEAKSGQNTAILKDDAFEVELQGGAAKLEMKSDSLEAMIGTAKLELSSSKFEVTIAGNTFTIEATGTSTTMDLTAMQISVSTHTHFGVFPGFFYTAVPS